MLGFMFFEVHESGEKCGALLANDLHVPQPEATSIRTLGECVGPLYYSLPVRCQQALLFRYLMKIS